MMVRKQFILGLKNQMVDPFVFWIQNIHLLSETWKKKIQKIGEKRIDKDSGRHWLFFVNAIFTYLWQYLKNIYKYFFFFNFDKGTQCFVHLNRLGG
jgi:hypothetical protein